MWHKVYLDDLVGTEKFLFFHSLRIRRHVLVSFPRVAILAVLIGLIFLFQPLFVL